MKWIDFIKQHSMICLLAAVLILALFWPGNALSRHATAIPTASAAGTEASAEIEATRAPSVSASAPLPTATSAPSTAAESEPDLAEDDWPFDPADPRTAEEYSDEELIYWSAGTFDSAQDSLSYHFAKHGEELPAETVADYLDQAYETRDEVLTDTDGWRITISSGANDAHKYKNLTDSRFIILDDETQLIYSFGR